MKKILAILVMGIGIVLSIPKSVQAVDNCNFNAANSNAIGAGYGDKTKIHFHIYFIILNKIINR